MKRTLQTLFIATFLIFSGCNSAEESDPNGEVYFKVSVGSSLIGSESIIIGNAMNLNTLKNGKDFKTQPFIHGSNENLSIQVISTLVLCKNVAVEIYFKGKLIKSELFEMGAIKDSNSLSLCKDGQQQFINIITPK